MNLRGIKVVRTDAELHCPVIDAHLTDCGADLVLLPDNVTEDDLARELEDADLLLMCYTPVSRKVLDKAAVLKGIVKYGVGIDAIDIDAAKARSIPVVNVPEYAEQTVAEGAFCLLLALAKQLIPLDRAMKTEQWVWPTQQWLGHDIAGKTIGIIGCGHIGRSFARMAQGFRARVIGFDPHVSASTMHAIGVEKSEHLQSLLTQSDYVSLHCVLSPDTHHLIGGSELAQMKNSATLINVSRGALVDEVALLTALKEGQIAAAGLDVFSQEPLDQHSHPLKELYRMDNVILSPHLTFYTHEAMQRLETETLERCKEILSGQPVVIKSADPRLRSQTAGVHLQ